MNNRRTFIKKIGGVAGALSLGGMLDSMNSFAMNNAFERVNNLSPLEVATDEDFWSYIQQCYTVSTTIVNLNSGGVSPQPKIVQDAFERYNRLCNEGPSYYMWEILDKGREPLRIKLADLAGCSPEEIVINRNTTEALETVIFGLDFQKNDEVVATNYCYPSMINAFKQREKRDGIVLKQVTLSLPSENDAEIVAAFENAFTSKTKLVLITHMINWTGQILPVKAIAKAAHARGIEVMVDAAHTFAHMDYKISDLDCDYFGTSLHKWLCAPFGTGMLYVKKDKIKNVWPLFAMSWDKEKMDKEDDIRKLEKLGTHSIPTEQAIGQAINFHLSIGSKRKEERLRYLKNYWTKKVINIPGVKLQTSLKPEYSCGLSVFSIEGAKPNEWMKPNDIKNALFDKYKIYSTPIDHEQIHGIRITPNVFTTLKDLDLLVTAIGELAKDAKKSIENKK